MEDGLHGVIDKGSENTECEKKQRLWPPSPKVFPSTCRSRHHSRLAKCGPTNMMHAGSNPHLRILTPPPEPPPPSHAKGFNIVHKGILRKSTHSARAPKVGFNIRGAGAKHRLYNSSFSIRPQMQLLHSSLTVQYS
eukprot:12399107-Karenia_brevis.AAC.1